MTAKDYDELGFLCGLEVHQQLQTRGKLFCRCPAGVQTTRVDAELLRHMRPTLSEMGEYDGCALMEFKTRKEIVYQLARSCTCTYEMDDTPPFEIDEEAVRSALAISRLFGLQLISELHVMRKQYLDGSIPTGFQRTAMLGVGGVIPFRESELGPRELRIRQLTLEEDSCREVADVGHRITFRTDRLGMPLIETVTEPDLLTPGDVELGGRLLARVARASGLVRRGAGAARQDVNVSIAGSRRVEIKGVSQHRVLPRLVHIEAFRHLELLRIRAELERRSADRSLFAPPAPGLPWETSELVTDVTRMFRTTVTDMPGPAFGDSHDGAVTCAVRLRKCAGILACPTQPSRTFADEIADRVRVIACLDPRSAMLHSDRPQTLSASAWRELRRAVVADAVDAVIVLAGPAEDVATAAREVLIRAADATIGVPSETRQAFADGTTGFERILPGADRMYPDTDTPPLPIPDAWCNPSVVADVELPWDQEARLLARGLDQRTARALLDAPWADLFDAVSADATDALVPRLAHALAKQIPPFLRKHPGALLPTAGQIRPIVEAVRHGRMHICGLEATLEDVLRRGTASPDAIVSAHCHQPGDQAALRAAIEAATQALGNLRTPCPEARQRWAMGRVLRALPRGRIDPAEARRAIRAALGLDSSADEAAR